MSTIVGYELLLVYFCVSMSLIVLYLLVQNFTFCVPKAKKQIQYFNLVSASLYV